MGADRNRALGVFSTFCNPLGLCAWSVPAGRADGFGVTVFAPAQHDRVAADIAGLLECSGGGPVDPPAGTIALMVVVVVAVSVLTSMSGVGVIAYRMLGTPADRDVILDLMSIAGLAALIVALFVSGRLIKASRAISTAVQDTGDSGVYIAPPLILPSIDQIRRRVRSQPTRH